MIDLQIPDLSFPMVTYGKTETPMDLRILLYAGGAKASRRTVFNQIAEGNFGSPIIQRIELVRRIHEVLTAAVVAGGSKITTSSKFKQLRDLFAWADDSGHELSLTTVEASYRHWCDFKFQLIRHNKLKQSSAYAQAAGVSAVLADVLDRRISLVSSTLLRAPRQGKRVVGLAADKQNLADTFAFGHLCLDIINSLTTEAIYFTPLPVKIRLRNGKMLEEWTRLRDPETIVSLQPGFKDRKGNRKLALQTRANWENDRTLRTRYPLVNLRLLCEISVFIAQTGMNLEQACTLRRFQFSYKSTIDGYEVRSYKERRKGEVLFEIFADYREHFDRYLAWRDKIFADEREDLLFPYIRRLGGNASKPPRFYRLKATCDLVGVPFINAQALRSTRVNWFLRQSRNPDLTAEQAQHTKQTLLCIYEKPSLHVAQIEIIKFWKKNDPRLADNPMPSPAPGVCDGVPKPLPDLPPQAPKPNCSQPTGCLFCEHHRDVDSDDYVWSVASMRYLNTIILRRFRPVTKHKNDAARHIELAIDVMTTKLKWFNESNAKRKAWVVEATAKVAEGDFHIYWRYLIESAEAV